MVFGRVYTIRSHQTTDIYIGSTTQTLSQRMTDHRKNYKQYLDKKKNYITSYEIVQYEDAYIELLFEGEFESVNYLHRKEGEYQREMDCVNKMIAGRTHKEWREAHKPHILERVKKYAVEHRDHILEYQQEWRKKNPDVNKQYVKDHREQINEKKRQKIKCECGSTICKGAKLTHIKSKKHQAFIQSLCSGENSS